MQLCYLKATGVHGFFFNSVSFCSMRFASFLFGSKFYVFFCSGLWNAGAVFVVSRICHFNPFAFSHSVCRCYFFVFFFVSSSEDGLIHLQVSTTQNAFFGTFSSRVENPFSMEHFTLLVSLYLSCNFLFLFNVFLVDVIYICLIWLHCLFYAKTYLKFVLKLQHKILQMSLRKFWMFWCRKKSSFRMFGVTISVKCMRKFIKFLM